MLGTIFETQHQAQNPLIRNLLVDSIKKILLERSLQRLTTNWKIMYITATFPRSSGSIRDDGGLKAPSNWLLPNSTILHLSLPRFSTGIESDKID